MSGVTKAVGILLFAIVFMLPYTAQPKGPERRAIPRPAVSHVSVPSAGAAKARNSATIVVPGRRGASFMSPRSYVIWTNYYAYLSRQFDVNPLYFRRFYYNTEPLITPEILRLTLRAPLQTSLEMLNSIDELQAMIENSKSGNTLDRQAVLEKCERIRDLAKNIRSNQTLSYIDVGQGKDLYSQKAHDTIRPEDFQKLREMAVDLNRQLKNLYASTSTATVSIDSYKEPSLESLAKGIEKMCKAIENSSKRM